FYVVTARWHGAATASAGMVWFGIFPRFWEEAEEELFRPLGRPRLDLIRDLSILMPRVDASCKFRSPARAEEVLVIGIAVHEMTERRISYLFEAHQLYTDTLVCEGAYRVACVAADTFKPRDFPPQMRLLINRLPPVIADQRSERRRSAAGWA